MLRIVKTGIWLYDNEVETPVDVIALDYDWWYSLAETDGMLEEGEVPKSLGPDNVLYYVRFTRALQDSEPTCPDSEGYETLDQAMEYAQEKVPGGVLWN